jgi:hypothetical protein
MSLKHSVRKRMLIVSGIDLPQFRAHLISRVKTASQIELILLYYLGSQSRLDKTPI